MKQHINIAIESHPFFLNKIFEFLQKDFDLEPFYLSLLNIDKQKIVKFNINEPLELRSYFSKYLYTLNELLFSFNAVLLKKYIIKKTHENFKDDNWDGIFDKGNKKNKITYLLSELFFNDSDNDYYLDLIHRFYLYENLFRHQLSHGWIDIFPHIFDETCNLNIKIAPIVLDKNYNIKDFIFESDLLSLDMIRQKLKKDYYFNPINPNKSFIFEEVEPSIVKASDKNNDIFIFELVKPILVDYSHMNEVRIKEHKSFIPVSPQEKSLFDFFERYYQKKIEKNHMEEINLSLNKVIEDIYLAILRI